MKTHCTTIAAALAAALSASAKTFDWPIDAPAAGARQFTAYHGETVRFDLRFGGAMTNLSPVCIYYQTNGMGKAEWFGPLPGTVFHPTNDCGAASYRFFVLCDDPDGIDYTANGTLRLLDSPGFEPNAVQPPVKTLDFSEIQVLNPPWEVANPPWAYKVKLARVDYMRGGGDPISLERVDFDGFEAWTFSVDYGWEFFFGRSGDGSWKGRAWREDEFIPMFEASHRDPYLDFGDYIRGEVVFTNALDETEIMTLEYDFAEVVYTRDMPTNHVTQAELDAAMNGLARASDVSDALSYSRATYDFMQGNTNAWFSGTNYVFGADATNKTVFAFEEGMDLATMPCSLALMERRDGITQKVWDQRDWTAWYWSFKSAQHEATVAARFAAAAEFNATNYAPVAWGRRTSSGLANPDRKTVWVDAERTVLAPGMAWESTVEVSGCAYWTLVGSATLSGTTNGVIVIRDFEGNPVFSITKTASRLAYLETGSEIYTQGRDAQGRVTFTMRSPTQPVAEFSTVLDDSLFVEETDAGCPADWEWETVESGVYRIHFLLKPGILSDACFAKFKVEIQGETAVEFAAAQKIAGGLIYDDGTHGDVKIRPVISSTTPGSAVTWEVAP